MTCREAESVIVRTDRVRTTHARFLLSLSMNSERNFVSKNSSLIERNVPSHGLQINRRIPVAVDEDETRCTDDWMIGQLQRNPTRKTN